MAPDKLNPLVFLVIRKAVSRIEAARLIPVPIEVLLRKVRQEQIRGGIGCLVIEVDFYAAAGLLRLIRLIPVGGRLLLGASLVLMLGRTLVGPKYRNLR